MLFHTENRWAMLLVAAAVTCLVSGDSVMAKKGGGGGGGRGPAYNLVRLSPPGITITGSFAHDLDEAGNVVGYFNSAGQSFGFRYDSSQNSWLLFGAGIKALGINNVGEMVGRDENTVEGLYWRFPNDQNPVTLSPLAGDQGSSAIGINDAGIIIGESLGGSITPVAWAVDDFGTVSGPVELPRLAGDTVGSVKDLNQSDQDGVTQVVGASGSGYPGDIAIRWEVAAVSGVPVLVSGPSNLGSFGGTPSVAYGVNFLGDIVGQSGNWPFLKIDGQPMQPLAGIRKATDGFALDVNDAGVIAGDQGYLSRGQYIQKAVLWTNGSVQELDKKVNLGASETLESASRINNAGRILGSGYFPGVANANNVGFLLIPTQ